jgi:hypothetical protein
MEPAWQLLQRGSATQTNFGEHAMPDQPYPFTGFAAGTPLLTPDGIKPIEDIKLCRTKLWSQS